MNNYRTYVSLNGELFTWVAAGSQAEAVREGLEYKSAWRNTKCDCRFNVVNMETGAVEVSR